MKTAPAVRIPRLVMSDIVHARQVLGKEPKYPIGVVLSVNAFNELVRYRCKFPCPVAVDVTAPRDTVAWFYLEASFQQFSHLIRT